MQASQVSASNSANILGKYRLIAELGHGGMAEVFLAVVRGPAGFNKLVVIKQIRPQLAEDPEFLGMFLDEARLAARLSHPNVVQTNEVGEEGGRFFIAMEYLEGQPLNRLIHRLHRSAAPPGPNPRGIHEAPARVEGHLPSPNGGMPLSIHLKIISEVLSGLHHAHELADYDGTLLHVVHRDVTPHNIFVTYEGQVKVVDFGIAKALNSSSETRTGVLKGKVAYMAPEQAQGERVDRRADVFSVGVLLWEATTGKRLWKGVPDITILQRLLTGEIPSPRTINPHIPERLEAIILKALAHRREDRYSSALELQAAIDDFLDSAGERVSLRDIGKLVAATFEADRARIKSIIDEQLRAPPIAVPPALHLTDTSGSLPVVDPSLQPVAALSARHSRDGPSVRREATRSPSYTGPSMLFTSSAALPEDASFRERRRRTWLALALAATVLVGVALWLFVRNSPTAAPDETAKVATSAAPPPAPAPALVELNITVTPAEAKIFLDDKPLTNPFKGKLTSDAGNHHLRVEARGFVTQNRPVSLERAVEIELVLQKDPTAVEKAVSPPAPSVRPIQRNPPTEGALRKPGVNSERTIDTSNPY
jgi:eukaryotic-like serine/threonine-protein kinase